MSNINWENFGVNMRIRRIAKHYKLKDISKKTGIAIKSLSQYENAKEKPSLKNYLLICLILDISLDTCFGITKENRQEAMKKILGEKCKA